jgi:hypothetical protein
MVQHLGAVAGCTPGGTATAVSIPWGMVQRAPTLVVLSALLLACSGPSRRGETAGPPPALGDAGIDAPYADEHIPAVSGPARLLEGRYFVDDGAPHPLACLRDKDCVGDTVPDETGCCVRSSEAYPQTWAWHSWVTDRRLSGGCEAVRCPPLPMASMPELCRLKVRCAERRCVNTCDSPEPGKEQEGRQ